jgi:dipeptide transport system substrate-binding protein
LLFFEINCGEEPLSNPRVRQAMAMCFDYDAFDDITYKGYGAPTNNPISPQMFGYKDVGMYEYNPDKAKGILKEEGYPDGFDLTIECLSGPDQYEQMSVIWKDGLDKAGINTNVEVSEAQVWLDKFLNHKYQVTINEYATRGDPFSFFNTVILGDRLVEFFENEEEIKEMVKEADTLIDEKERAKKFAELQDWIFEELPGVFVIYRAPYLMGMKENIEGVTINAIGNYDFSHAYLK